MSDPSPTSPSLSESFPSSRLLRLPVVAARVGLSATTIWRQRRRGQFPDPVRISPGCVAWREADVESWIASQSEARVGDAGPGGADMIPRHIEDLWNRGFSLVPIRPGDKRPAVKWKEFQLHRLTHDELENRFGGPTNYNVGIVTGAVSGIVVLDCDSPDAVAWADEHLPPTRMATRTAKGEHRFYRHPGGRVSNTVRVHTGEARIEIDVRADGGYVVGPGSVHETGARYEKVGDWPPIDELPVFDPAATQDAPSDDDTELEAR